MKTCAVCGIKYKHGGFTEPDETATCGKKCWKESVQLKKSRHAVLVLLADEIFCEKLSDAMERYGDDMQRGLLCYSEHSSEVAKRALREAVGCN